MKRKLIAVLCLAALLVGLMSACNKPVETSEAPPPAAPSEAPPSPQQPDEELPGFKIGLIAYTNAGLWWDRVLDAVTITAKAYNCEIVIAQGDIPPATIAAVESLCASGVDGIISQATAGVTARLIEICEANEVFFVAIHNDTSMDEGYAGFSKNPYFVGDVFPNEYEWSYKVTKDMIAAGSKNFVIFGLPPGVSTSFDERAGGAMQAVKDAGLTDAIEARSFALPEIANTFLQQYPDTDAVYSIVCASTYITNPIMSAGYAGKMKVATYDDEGDTVGVMLGSLTMKLLTSGMLALGIPAALQNVGIGVFLMLFIAFTTNQEKFKEARDIRKRIALISASIGNKLYASSAKRPNGQRNLPSGHFALDS